MNHELELDNAVAALLPPHPYKSSGLRHQGRRRFRGQKRYYQQIQRKAQDFRPDLSAGHWYDFWHYHADWPGYGNQGWKHRRSHIQALCTVFRTFAQDTSEYDQPYQLWLYLDREDAGQDGVYFHTPNPNGGGTHFPAKPAGVQWGLPALEQFLSGQCGFALRAGVEARTGGHYMYYVYSPAHGQPLE